MTRSLRSKGAAVGLLVGSLASAGSVYAQGAPAFTAEQAARGQNTYAGAGGCAACHGADLAGGQFGPALKGVTFRQRWAGATMAEIFEQVRNMPPGGARSLSDATYADLSALILAQNGYTAGSQPFPTDQTQLQAMALPGTRVVPVRGGAGGGLTPGVKLPFYPVAPNPLDSIRPVTEQLLANPPEGSWLQWRRTWDAQGYSTLGDINKSNVRGLQTAWSIALPAGANTTTPLVHDGVMFMYAQDNVVALNAVNGELLWRYTHALPEGVRPGGKRSLSLYNNKVYMPTSDGRVVALDMQTGRVVWNEVIDEPTQARTSSGTVAAKGKIMIGVGGRMPGGGFVQAFDSETGAKAWRFYSIARPDEPGGNTWNDLPLEARNGGTIWTPGNYDPVNDVVFFGPAPTYDTGPLRDPIRKRGVTNDALYTNSTVALDPDTGKVVWQYQHMQNDQWDMDWSFERQTIELPVNGQDRRLTFTGGKLGIFDAVDAKTGAYVFSVDMGIQNAVTRIDPKTGKKTVNADLIPGDGKEKLICPHGGGGRSWLPTSYNPNSKVLFIPAVENCMRLTPVAAGERGNLTTGVRWSLEPRPDSDGKFGRLQAINLETKQTVWTQRERAANTTGVLSTAGGVLFAGSVDRWFKAYDQATGDILWKVRLSDVPSSAPITYTVAGKQYVAMVVGYGGPQSVSFPSLTPEFAVPMTPSASVWVFALP